MMLLVFSLHSVCIMMTFCFADVIVLLDRVWKYVINNVANTLVYIMLPLAAKMLLCYLYTFKWTILH